VAFSPDGNRIASASDDRTVRVWDATTGQATLTLRVHTGPVWGVAFSPDGSRIASASVDQTVKVWDATTGQETLTLKGHTGPVFGVAFSPDGSRIASASVDQTVKVWDARTGQETLTLKGHTGPVFGVAFSPDGSRIASASYDQTVRVWDARTGQATLTLREHAGPVQGVVFSPDGSRIASASDDRTVRVWDARTGQETLTLKGHTDWVRGVAFSPDGSRMASASGDQTVEIWESAPTTPESLARDDAMRLIRLLVEGAASEAELRDRIAGDKAISERVRTSALNLAAGFWARRIKEQAESLVEALFDKPLFREEVMETLHADRTLIPEIRAAALELARSWTESVERFNAAAWTLVQAPGHPEADTRRALRLAAASCRLRPDSGPELNTLGVAQYRAGQYALALTTLERSNTLNGQKEPADLAFLAMAQYQLGQLDQAQATLERLRGLLDQSPNHTRAMNLGFLREAESLIELDAAFPTDPFAR
jgi:hypothetical protein